MSTTQGREPQAPAGPINPLVQRARDELAAKRRRRQMPLLIAVMVVVVCGMVGLVVGGLHFISGLIAQNPVAVEGLAIAKAAPEVQAAIGLPVRVDGRWTGRSEEGPNRAQLEAEVSLRGDRGLGVFHIVGTSDAGVVAFSRLELLPAGGAAIDLRAAAAAREAERIAAQQAPDLDEAKALVRQGQLDAAAAIVDRLLHQSSANLEAGALRAQIREAQEDYAGAEADLLVILGQDPQRGVERHRLGRVQGAAGKTEACRQTFTLLIQDNANDGEAWLGRARCQRAEAEASGDPAGLRAAAAGAREACRLNVPAGCTLSKELAP